ncbi:MAG: hypothetical protein IT367_17600 [Candidatus Hydrogenedentes bacterium]|nr:hypothetical protein [Candidatus Hydrogenedentota bacterium]
MLQLLLERIGESTVSSEDLADWQSITEMDFDLTRVPEPGEIVPVNWRHNLGQGAVPQVIDESAPEYMEITSLAIQAAASLGVALASVDIVATQDGYKVLEMNSGIMMESLVRFLPDGEALAYRFYDAIIARALGLS